MGGDLLMELQTHGNLVTTAVLALYRLLLPTPSLFIYSEKSPRKGVFFASAATEAGPWHIEKCTSKVTSALKNLNEASL